MLFEIKEKTGKDIHLSEKRWSHIMKEHPNVQMEEIKRTIEAPTKVVPSKYDPIHVRYYYSFNKLRKQYLLIAVRYLNGHGFVITAYYVRIIP
ncbi:MAG: hypothetical protein Q8R18_06005 [bacterium]|nr:hypothetical protein [bacterium]